jgi:indole-3-acetate monooxygenase
MVGATAIASLGTFLPPAGLEKVFKNGSIPTAAISFFPAGRAVRDGDGYRVNGRWRFNSGIRHAEWVLGGTVVEGTEAENGGRPIVMFSAFPIKDVTIHDNWGGVVGLRGTGSCDFSVENYHLPEDLTFVWDLLKPKPRRGGPSYLFPRSAMSPRSTAASPSARPDAHSMSSLRSRRRRAAPSALRASTNARSCIAASPKPI